MRHVRWNMKIQRGFSCCKCLRKMVRATVQMVAPSSSWSPSFSHTSLPQAHHPPSPHARSHFFSLHASVTSLHAPVPSDSPFVFERVTHRRYLFTSRPKGIMSGIIREMGALLRDPKFWDLEVRCEGRSYYVHRVIVCSNSPVLARECESRVRHDLAHPP